MTQGGGLGLQGGHSPFYPPGGAGGLLVGCRGALLGLALDGQAWRWCATRHGRPRLACKHTGPSSTASTSDQRTRGLLACLHSEHGCSHQPRARVPPA